MSEQLFSADELREMGKRTLDRLVDAVGAGDPDAAKKIAQLFLDALATPSSS